MLSLEDEYIKQLKLLVYKKISNDINRDSLDSIVEFDLIKRHVDDKTSSNFQNITSR